MSMGWTSICRGERFLTGGAEPGMLSLLGQAFGKQGERGCAWLGRIRSEIPT